MRNICDPGQPTAKEHQKQHDHTSSLQIMVQIQCDKARCERAGDPMLKTTWWDCRMCGFLGEKESEDRVSPVLFIRERRHKMTWAMLVPRKGVSLDLKESNEVHRSTQAQHSHAQLRQRAEQLKHWRERLHKPAKKGVQCQTGLPVGQSQSNGIIAACGGRRCRPGH